MDLSNKLFKTVVGIGLVLLGGIAAVIYGFHLFEAENVQRGSISYYLGLPASVRSIPLVEECQAPVYRWRGRDGESVPYISATYGSRSSPHMVSDFYTNALRQFSCVSSPAPAVASSGKSLVQFQCQGRDFLSISVWVGNEPSCRSVRIDFMENY